MKTILVSALALGAMTSVALAAEPAKGPVGQAKAIILTDAEMDNVTAGSEHRQQGLVNVSDVNVFVAVQAICVGDAAPGCIADNRPRQ